MGSGVASCFLDIRILLGGGFDLVLWKRCLFQLFFRLVQFVCACFVKDV